jgi:hypothetical protein
VTVDAHLARARRFEASMAKLDPAADFEMLVWSAMHAGTHFLNAALHAAGVTVANRAYPSNHAGHYFVPAEAGFREGPGPLGDVIHADMPPVPGPIPPVVARAMDALRVVERVAADALRAPAPVAGEARARWRAAYETAKAACLEAVRTEADPRG